MNRNDLSESELRDLIRVKDSPVELIQKNPAWIFGNRSPNAIDLVSLLAKELLSLGCTEMSVEVIDSWYIISSSTDWMRSGTELNPNQQFFLIVPLSELGLNQIRFEIAIVAFAEEVVTRESGLITEIKGENLLSRIPSTERMLSSKRSIAFRLM